MTAIEGKTPFSAVGRRLNCFVVLESLSFQIVVIHGNVLKIGINSCHGI